MNFLDSKMAAETQRLMDSPMVKAGIKLAQTVAGALLIGFCQSAVTKLDGIQNSINGFSKDIALVQRDLSQVKTTQDNTTKDMAVIQTTVLQQGFELKQLRKEFDGRGH